MHASVPSIASMAQDGAIFDDHALADVETAHLLGHFPAERNVLSLSGRRHMLGQTALGYEQLRGVIGRRSKYHPSLTEGFDDRSQERVVAAVFTSQDEMGIERSQAGPVGQVLDPHPRLIQSHFVDLCRPSRPA